MSEWMPIESAPKDGTWVLLTGGRTDEDFYMEDQSECARRPVVAFYENDELESWASGWRYDFWDGAWRSTYEGATHWQPLPAPPQGETT